MTTGLILTGGPSNQYLYGGMGDDTFYVGSGNEYISGGGGSDTAVFNILSSQITGISLIPGGYTIYSSLGTTHQSY